LDPWPRDFSSNFDRDVAKIAVDAKAIIDFSIDCFFFWKRHQAKALSNKGNI
jgi:hypothetical protein